VTAAERPLKPRRPRPARPHTPLAADDRVPGVRS
jgi:hypothetical protein